MKKIIIIFLFLYCQLLISQEVLTLQKAISIGLENNYGILISDKFIEISENNNTWAKSGKSPTIDLIGSFNNGLTEDQNPASFLQGTFYNGGLNLGLDANWVLYNGGRIKINKEQLNLVVHQQKLNKEIEIQNLLRIIYQQYYNVIFQKEQFGVLQSSIEVSKDRLDYEISKKEYGASNSYNIIQFETAFMSDSTNLINQIQNIESAERNLLKTLNIKGYKSYKYEERLSVVLEEIDSEKLKAQLEEDNFTLKSLELAETLNVLNTQIQQSIRKPIINLNGGLNVAQNGFKFFGDNPQTGEAFGFQDSRRFNGSINLSMRYNIYDGGIIKTDIQSAKLQQEIDQLNIIEAQVELNNQLDILINNYKRQNEVLSLLDTQINLAQKNLDITEERFKAGQVTSLDFRNIQTLYINTAFNKVSAIYNLLITKSEIDYLVGTFGK